MRSVHQIYYYFYIYVLRLNLINFNLVFVYYLCYTRYATLRATQQRADGWGGPDSTKVRGGVLWDSGADFRAIVRILPMAKKTPKKGPPRTPPKGSPGPPKKDPPKGPPENP